MRRPSSSTIYLVPAYMGTRKNSVIAQKAMVIARVAMENAMTQAVINPASNN